MIIIYRKAIQNTVELRLKIYIRAAIQERWAFFRKKTQMFLRTIQSTVDEFLPSGFTVFDPPTWYNNMNFLQFQKNNVVHFERIINIQTEKCFDEKDEKRLVIMKLDPMRI